MAKTWCERHHRKPRRIKRWGILWRSVGGVDGTYECIYGGLASLYKTKREALAAIKERHGYIAKRPDLRRYPHGWRVPKPVRVTVTIALAARAEWSKIEQEQT